MSQKMNKILVPLLLGITIVAVSVTVWAVFLRKPQQMLAPDYAPIEQEANAQKIEGENGDKMVAPKGGGSVSLSYSNKVSIDLSEKVAVLSFSNPGKSTQDMVLQIVVQDVVLVQSGTLTPGNRITKLDLPNGIEKQLAPGGYEGMFKIFYYSPETGEKAMVNTQVPVSITVVP